MSPFSSAAAQKQLAAKAFSPSAPPFQSARARSVLFCLVLIAAVLAAYQPIAHNSFLNYDDDRYLTDNPHVHAGLTWATVKWAFTTYDEANWAPLSWLSHALDYRLFGLNPAGHHFVSVLLHAVNAVLLFLLLQSITGYSGRSIMVAALFALHPINVESVAWAAELKNVLSMMFLLLGLHAYIRYTRKRTFARYAVVFVAFGLGLLSKSQIVTFPCLLLLLDYWPLSRIPDPFSESRNPDGPMRKASIALLLLEKMPLLLLSAASSAITMHAEKAGGAVQDFSRYSLGLRLETGLISYARYLGKALWPSKLVALYPHPTTLYPPWQVAAAVILLALITILVLAAQKQPYLAVGWLWFLGSMVPMIGLVQVGPQAMADRFAYLPFIGLFLMGTWLAAELAEIHKIRDRWLVVGAICCISLLGALSYRQTFYWHDVPTFWQRTLDLTQNNYIAENNLGDILFKEGRADEAAAHFRAALAMCPDNLLANLNLAAYEDSRGDLSAATQRYQTIVLRTNDVDIRASAFTSMGFDYRATRQPGMAKQYFEAAVKLAPHRTRAIVGLGLLAQESGDWQGAIRQYSQAVAVHPTDVGYLLLAKAFEHQGQLDNARAALSRIENPVEAQKAAADLLSGM